MSTALKIKKGKVDSQPLWVLIKSLTKDGINHDLKKHPTVTIILDLTPGLNVAVKSRAKSLPVDRQ